MSHVRLAIYLLRLLIIIMLAHTWDNGHACLKILFSALLSDKLHLNGSDKKCGTNVRYTQPYGSMWPLTHRFRFIIVWHGNRTSTFYTSSSPHHRRVIANLCGYPNPNWPTTYINRRNSRRLHGGAWEIERMRPEHFDLYHSRFDDQPSK